MEIREDNLSSQAVQALLIEHQSDMASQSPPESNHTLDRDALIQPGITFWCAWEEDALMGCGALKALGNNEAEIKSMRTSTDHRRKGVGEALLVHIIEQAKQLGYTRINLETGAQAAFKPAIGLYEKFGFTYCGPFAGYLEDPNSVFMTKDLAG